MKAKNSPSTVEESPAPLTVTQPALLVDNSDDAFRELVHASLAFSARLQAVREGFAEVINLTGPQYTILISIAHLQASGVIGVKELATHLCLSGTFVTTEVNKLVKMGLVLKEKDASDGRRVSLSVTCDAEQLLSTLSGIQQQVNNVHFGSLSAEEFSLMRKIMPDLVKSTDIALSLLKHLSAAAKAG